MKQSLSLGEQVPETPTMGLADSASISVGMSLLADSGWGCGASWAPLPEDAAVSPGNRALERIPALLLLRFRPSAPTGGPSYS